MADKLYGTSDLCNIFGVTRQTIKTWIDDGRFPNAQLVGRSYAIPASDFEAVRQEEIERLKDSIMEMQKQIEALESFGG